MKRPIPWFEAAVTALVLLCLWLSARLFVTLQSAQAASLRAEAVLTASRASQAEASALLANAEPADVPGAGEAPDEDAHIEAALLDAGYLSDAVPLSYELQDVLRTACAEYGPDYPLMLGLVEQESGFENVAGDGGASAGLCQIQEQWWAWLMAEIGTTDLTDPAQNLRTGCAVLGYLLDRFGSETDALTAYNTGSPGASAYASQVLARAAVWEEAIK